MSVLALLLVQAVAGPPAPKPVALTTPRCPTTDAVEGEVIVCARRGESPHRLKPPAPLPAGPPSDPLAFRLPGGGEGRLQAVQSRNPTATGYGLGVTLRVPLGRKKPATP